MAYTLGMAQDLSPRETQIMALVADGLTNKQIGARLYLSPSTVKSHLARIAIKLGTEGDRAGMVATLFRKGVLT